MTFIKLKPPELSAIALARSRFGTTLGIMLIRTGSVIVQATPVINVKKNMPDMQKRRSDQRAHENRGDDQYPLCVQEQLAPVHAVGGHPRHGPGDQERQGTQTIQRAEQHRVAG